MADLKPRFTYFAGRGLGEVSRIALHAAGIEYEDVYLQSRDEFLQLIKDEKLLFKQVPLLEIDGQNLIGSEAVLRFIGRKGNLYGKNDAEKTRIDMLLMGAKDMFFAGLSSYSFKKTPEERESVLKAGLKAAKDRYLPVFEKVSVLSESSSGFLVGDSISIADILLFDVITHISDTPKLKPELADFSHCRAFIDHISNLPPIKAYLTSPRRHLPPDEEYVRVVNVVLGR